ncbi:hypothetical protein OAE93_01050 [bacterium]|nr:hypothetical protein [bacterium]
MKNSFLKIGVVVLVVGGMLAGCGFLKNLLDPNVQKFNEDYNNYKSELESLDNDLDNAIKDIDGFGKTGGTSGIASSPLCGVTIDCTQVSQGILIFNFDGVTPCFSPSRTRSGAVQVELINGTSWAEAGAVMKQTFIDYKVTVLSNSRSIQVNGIKTLKNVNGHDWWGWIQGNIDHTYQSRAFNVDVVFDNGQTAVWNHARTSTISWNPNGADSAVPNAHLAYSVNGDTTLNGVPTMDSWGTNRFGDAFTTRYEEEITSNTYCGLWRFSTGRLVHEVASDDFTLELGVDQNGNQASTACAYGYEVSWNIGNNSNSVVLSY